VDRRAFAIAPQKQGQEFSEPGEDAGEVVADGGAAAQLAPDDAALLAGDENAPWVLRAVAAVSFVDIGPLDRTAGERVRAVDDVPQDVTVVELSGSELACSRNRPP
jgi:hypothetical protein